MITLGSPSVGKSAARFSKLGVRTILLFDSDTESSILTDRLLQPWPSPRMKIKFGGFEEGAAKRRGLARTVIPAPSVVMNCRHLTWIHRFIESEILAGGMTVNPDWDTILTPSLPKESDDFA